MSVWQIANGEMMTRLDFLQALLNERKRSLKRTADQRIFLVLNMVLRVGAFTALATMLLVQTGCSYDVSARITPPKINANAAAESALSQYDSDGNGVIDATELEASPALTASASRIDTNNDGVLSVNEIAARVQGWLDSDLGMMSYRCRVLLDGRPLAGVSVTLQPEAFLGDTLHPASVVTDRSGTGRLSVAEEHRPKLAMVGVMSGFYTVRVTRAESGLSIPPSYNSATTLGCEISPDLINSNQYGLELNLTSRQ